MAAYNWQLLRKGSAPYVSEGISVSFVRLRAEGSAAI
jgi:hypothetical protein